MSKPSRSGVPAYGSFPNAVLVLLEKMVIFIGCRANISEGRIRKIDVQIKSCAAFCND